MKYILRSVLFFSCLTAVSLMYGQGKQECKCPDLKVMVFDFDNSAVQPAWYKGGPVNTTDHTRKEILEFTLWQDIPQEGSSAFTETSKAKNPEIHFKTGQFTPGKATNGNVFPPPGNQRINDDDVDYILTGKYVRAGDHFLLQVQLEDARNRDHFAEQTISMASLESAPQAAREAAAKLSPLVDIIRNYQHKIRDVKRKDETAINGKYELTAFQQSVNSGNTTIIKLKMYDCDDQSPLKNRKVKIKLLEGKSTVSPEEVTTDENGEAKTIFKAASQSETAKIYAEYQYTSVTNRNTYATLCGPDLQIYVGGAMNFFSLSGGPVFELHEPLNPKTSMGNMGETATYGQGQWTISISGFEKDMKNMRPMSIGVSFAGNAKGTYPCEIHGTKETGLQPPNTIISVSSMQDGKPFQYVSMDCTPHDKPNECESHTLEGTVTVTEFDEKNKVIKGFFSAKVVSPDGQYGTVSGGFRAYMH